MNNRVLVCSFRCHKLRLLQIPSHSYHQSTFSSKSNQRLLKRGPCLKIRNVFLNALDCQYTGYASKSTIINMAESCTTSIGKKKVLKKRPFSAQLSAYTMKRQRFNEENTRNSDTANGNNHKYRSWEYVPSSARRAGINFTFMTYNVLAQKLLEDNHYLYSHVNRQYLTWRHRKNELMREIKALSPDVLCLQEVDAEHYENFFNPILINLGYLGNFKKRTGDKPDGCATYFKADKFTMDRCVAVEFYRPGVSILDRDNVGLLTLLKPISEDVDDNVRLCLANTHLLFNPKRGDIKLAQISLLFSEIDSLIYKPGGTGYHPVILCGDFNSSPYSPMYNFICGKRLKVQNLLAKDVSGQGDRGGRYVKLSRDTLPPRIGIYDQCQYIALVNQRKSHQVSLESSKDSKKPAPSVDDNDGAVIKNEAKSTTPESQNMQTSRHTVGSGVLSHNFDLASVYKHKTDRAGKLFTEVSTQHMRACATVDFIFYTVDDQNIADASADGSAVNIENGNLELTARLKLMTKTEIKRMGGLPNKYHGSDHLPLVAKFNLK
ncbi:protein angel homolog 2-like [Tubulanus polymorphus]|uniref:protein angel homolog 2-like n=1 Tax=Tubulanus polymorphus TaxID=672921 RepID=UPI003DA61FA8